MRYTNSLVRRIPRALVCVLALWATGWIAVPAAQMLSTGDILKFDIGPDGQKVFPGFTGVGPETVYNVQRGYGWTLVPKYFDSFPRWEGFPDALACDLAAPSEPLTQKAAGYSGSFEFRLDVPRGEYRVAVMSGNYGYLPSEIEAYAYDMGHKMYYRPADEIIYANGQKAWSRGFTSQSMLEEFYHDLNTVLRRGMTLWDRVVDWRFPIRSFTAAAGKEGLVLRFENMPVNAIMVWPVAREADGQAFLKQLTAQRRASFPATDITPPPSNAMPELTPEARTNGYFLFAPHWSERIYPTTIPRAEWLKSEVRAAAAIGQFESFTVAVYPLRDLSRCRMTISDLEGPDRARLPASAVDVQVMRYMELQSGPGPDYETVAFLPLNWERLPVDSGMPRVWWFTLKVPPATPAGEYVGRITFLADNAPSASMGVRFRVYPFELAPLKNRFHALYHGAYEFPGGGIDRHVQWQRDAGLNVIATRGSITTLTYSHGVMSRPGFSDWARQLEAYRRNGFPMQLVVSQGALGAAYEATGEYRTEPGFEGPRQVKDHFSTKFEDCYKQLARSISDEFKRRGWPEIIFYESGAAGCEGPRGVRTETHLMRLLHEAGVKNTASVSGEGTPLSLRYSAPWMYLTILDEANEDNIRRVQQAGSRFGIYGPAETRFGRGFWFWRTGAILCSREGGVGVYVNPYDPFDGPSGYDWGDVFPAPNGPAISRRTAEKRAGIDDSRYLFQLEELATAAEKRGSEKTRQAAGRARTLLADLARVIEVDISNYETIADEPPGAILDRLREKVAEEITELQRVLRSSGGK